MIFGLDLVEWLTFVFTNFFKMTWRKTSYFFKLVRKMCYAAIAHFIRNFAKAKFIVYYQLFYSFYFLIDDKLFYGNTFYL